MVLIACTSALLASCSFFGAHPFPDYLGGLEKRIDISERIQGVLKTAVSARYEIGTVATPNGDRVLVLVDPAVSEPVAGSPTPALLVFDRSLEYIGSVAPESPLGYVGRPYAFAADGNILSGDTVFDPASGSLTLTLSPTGLAGFAFSATVGSASSTCIVSLPAGSDASSTLTVEIYNDMWSAPAEHLLPIVDGSSTSSYLLEGARIEADGDTITLVVRDTADDTLSVVQASLASVAADTAPPLLSAAPLAVLDGRSASVYVTRNDIILRRSTGTFERYTADGATMSASVTSDRRDGLVYAFSPDGAYLYRLDPATGSFLLIRSWW